MTRYKDFSNDAIILECSSDVTNRKDFRKEDAQKILKVTLLA